MPTKLWHRQQALIRQPFQGLDRSGNTEDLSEKASSVARCAFQQGYVEKKAGRTAVGGTDSAPLPSGIEHLYNYKKLDSTQRLLAWTATGVYNYAAAGTSLTNITGSATLHNTLGPISAVTYVNKMYFTNSCPDETPWYWSIGDAAITALGGSYQCRILGTYGERLIMLDTYEGGVWNGQRMRWSNVGNTTFSSGDFVDLVSFLGDDEIVGCAQLQSSFIIYGRRHILECSYTGSTTNPFAFTLRDANIGLSSLRGLFAERSTHYFLSADGLYTFDLSLTAKPFDQKVREWFLANSNKAYWVKYVMSKNELTSEILLYYTNAGSSANDRVLCFNTRTGVWTEDSRSCTCACYGGPTGQLTIDELSGTINAQTGTIDDLGQPTSVTVTYVGDSTGTVWKDWSGTNIGAAASILDYETKDFTFEDDGGSCWMAVEFLALGSTVTVSYSTDEGTTWTSLTATTLTAAWVRYRLDFESIGKAFRVRFYNSVVDETVQLRWFRLYVLRTSSGGTLPT